MDAQNYLGLEDAHNYPVLEDVVARLAVEHWERTTRKLPPNFGLQGTEKERRQQFDAEQDRGHHMPPHQEKWKNKTILRSRVPRYIIAGKVQTRVLFFSSFSSQNITSLRRHLFKFIGIEIRGGHVPTSKSRMQLCELQCNTLVTKRKDEAGVILAGSIARVDVAVDSSWGSQSSMVSAATARATMPCPFSGTRCRRQMSELDDATNIYDC